VALHEFIHRAAAYAKICHEFRFGHQLLICHRGIIP
jgi:hypothetical protein